MTAQNQETTGQATGREGETEHPVAEVREAHDAEHCTDLKAHPENEDAKLDVALDETFPTSDPPSNTQPGKGKDPAPSSGFDPEAEAELSSH